MPQDVPKGACLLDLVAQVVTLLFQVVPQPLHRLESVRVGDGHSRHIGHHLEPGPTGLVGFAASKDGEDAEDLSSKDERMTGEPNEALGSCPLRMSEPPPVFGQADDPNRFAGRGHVGQLERTVERHTVKASIYTRPIDVSVSRLARAGSQVQRGPG